MDRAKYIEGPIPEGLVYVPDFLSSEEHYEILRSIQHLFHFDAIVPMRSAFGLGKNDIIPHIRAVIERLIDEKYIEERPDSILATGYPRGIGIRAHVDSPDYYGKEISGISLGSSCIMKMTDQIFEGTARLLLMPRSLYILKDESRLFWKHEIPSDKYDIFSGQTYERSSRISITFRKSLAM